MRSGKGALSKKRRLDGAKNMSHGEHLNRRHGSETQQRRRASVTKTARRELEVLSAAIGYAHREHKLDYPVFIRLPEKAPAKDRWLTRDEAARLLWACRRTGARHVARFILIGLYTGTRANAIMKLRWLPSIDGGRVDLDAGVIHRKGSREIETSKRRPPLPLSKRLHGHLRGWKASAVGSTYVISWRGNGLQRLRTAWDRAREMSGLGPDVTPHVLRHTFASWAVQDGHSFAKVAAALGTTERIVEAVYGSHNLDRLRDVVETVSGAQSGARRRKEADIRHVKLTKTTA